MLLYSGETGFVMSPMEFENVCLTCFQPPGSDFSVVQSEKNSTTLDVLRKHFWFTDVDFHGALICKQCWDQVDTFHQFYVSVEQLHQNRLVSLIVVKSEPEVEENVRHQTDSPLEVSHPKTGDEQQKHSDSDEDMESSDDEFIYYPEEGEESEDSQSSDAKEQVQQSQKSKPKARVLKTDEQRQLDDDLIKTHVTFTCNLCGVQCKSWGTWKVHCMEAHGTNSAFVMCCDKRFYNKTELIEHVRVVDNPAAFRCQQCQKFCSGRRTLQRHMKEFHAADSKPVYKCDRCRKTFSLEFRYKEHMLDHIGAENKTWKCEHCGEIFKSVNLLRPHIKKKHPDVKPVDFVCDVCFKRFNKEWWFLQHKKKHEKLEEQEDENPGVSGSAQCKQCQKIFSCGQTLKRHLIEIHPTEKKSIFKCDRCGKTFSLKNRYTEHMQHHIGWDNKSWRCDECGQAYRSPNALRSHNRSKHAGNKTVCDKQKEENNDATVDAV